MPIIEIRVIGERNGNQAEVGNVCVGKFMDLPPEKIFKALRRIAKDDARALNPEAIKHAFEWGWINDWEHACYFDT